MYSSGFEILSVPGPVVDRHRTASGLYKDFGRNFKPVEKGGTASRLWVLCVKAVDIMRPAVRRGER